MPRSGHRWMMELLAASRPVFRYCERYTNTGCCGSAPCTNLTLHLTKCHDFDGRASKTNRRKYLIQIRDPLPSIVSHFELEARMANIRDCDESWRHFAIEQAQFRNRLTGKWLKKLPRHAMVLHYEDARVEPGIALGELYRFVFGEPPDDERIESLIGKVRDARNIESFRF